MEQEIELEFIDGRICTSCKEEKIVELFYTTSLRCIECENISGIKYRSTLNGFLQGLLNGCRRRSNKKFKVCNVTKQNLLEQYNKQKGKCYYSNIEMKYSHHIDWMMSIERLDESLGYDIDNVVLCCHEFNSGKNQWSLKKISDVDSLIVNKINIKVLKNEVQDAKLPVKGSNVKKKKIFKEDSEGNLKCHLCELSFNIKLFVEDRNAGCKTCRNNKKEKYESTLRGFIMRLVGAARSRVNAKKKQGRMLEFSIDYNCILDKIIEQKGRCFYSSIPLVFKIKSDWMCSLERLDNNIGYTDANVVLICNEFNTASMSSLSKNEVIGSGQWNKDKFKYFLESINKKN